MIFTIGKTDQYEPYIASDKDAAKRKGGTVWKEEGEARQWMRVSEVFKEYSVYGVDADWNMDVEIDPEDNGFYRLRGNAKLIKLN